MSGTSTQPQIEAKHLVYARALFSKAKVLLRLKETLYEGSWVLMGRDLMERRKETQVDCVRKRMIEDLGIIVRLAGYEHRNKIQLIDCLTEDD